MQKEIDKKNSEFWNEICGSLFAKSLGIKDHSLDSLKRFDDAYFSFYPYLLKHVPTHSMKGKKIMEVGLGYGTLGLKIAQSGADFVGLDIAEKPIEMMNHRLKLYHLPGKAIQGSILDCPLPNESLDGVVSIGCFHHTGNLKRCLEETYRVLKPGGHAYLMVYNQFSYRQWRRWPLDVFKALLREKGLLQSKGTTTEEQAAAYDSNLKGIAAPETAFTSIYQLKRLFSKFSSATFTKENCDETTGLIHKFVSRQQLLPILGRAMGLDIYIQATK